jgi:hypothetical protein
MILKFLSLSLVLSIASLSRGAPHPGAAGSVLLSKSNGLAFASKGFLLPSEGTDWRWVDENRFELNSSVLTIHTEELKKRQDMEQYSKHWLKEYTQFGFEMLGTKAIGDTQYPALLVDLYHRKTDKQIRQVIRINERKVAILTCSHDRKGFNEMLPKCNQLMEKFSWIRD